MSDMYMKVVPLYADLLSIVANVDDKVSKVKLAPRHRLERHGAIRLGTATELGIIARLFAIFGMPPVGYYDLTIVGFPLHATAFRPLTSDALNENPFRVFTSVLRLDLLPPKTRVLTETMLSTRNIFSERLLRLIEKYEVEGLTTQDEDELLVEALRTFQWHSITNTSYEDYIELNQVHPMVADIACFPSAHINHLTPRTLDIDSVQERMHVQGIPAKERIEGPPMRKCGILLRQTSFKALEEPVCFVGDTGMRKHGYHTARFGEVEQRGAAVTAKGRRLYDQLLGQTHVAARSENPDDDKFQDLLEKTFSAYPDTWVELQSQRLVFFEYSPSLKMQPPTQLGKTESLSRLVDAGYVDYEPIIYEDFLPISAAGIFTSNLRTSTKIETHPSTGNPDLFEEYMGVQVHDVNALYERMEANSLENCSKVLGLESILID